MDYRGSVTIVDRRNRPVPELVEEDLQGVPTIVLGAVLALFDQLEAYRPLLPEELSTREAISLVRDARNQLIEERFGRGSSRSANRSRPSTGPAVPQQGPESAPW